VTAPEIQALIDSISCVSARPKAGGTKRHMELVTSWLQRTSREIPACSAGVCAFIDSQTALSSYTVAPVTYFPKISLWPGDFVLGSSSDTNSAFAAATLTIDSLAAQVVSVAGATKQQSSPTPAAH